MNVKTVIKTYRELKYLRSVIKRYGDSLAPGKYYLFSSMRAMAHDIPETMDEAKKYFDKKRAKSKLTSLISKLNNTKYFYNKNKASDGRYGAVYTANNYDKDREVKLFSFKEKKILTICTSEKVCKKQIDQYKDLGNAFNMPKVVAGEKYENSIEVSMVELLPRPEEAQALENIIASHTAYNPKDRIEKGSIKEIIDVSAYSGEMRALMGKISQGIAEDIFSEDIAYSVQHGDLSKDNLIYGNSDGKYDFWWIDWEHIGKRVFFYDYFFYILNTAVYFDDLRSFEYYMSEESNRDLEKFFKHFSVEFDEERKKDYFLVFCMSFLKERVCQLGNLDALKMYCDFISKLFYKES
ncbi:MAG: hypothetical protein E7607_03990 [Ruminococcaceae bacterium]|nr:hypothetical protein [Oscillospiraceae bacterium]